MGFQWALSDATLPLIYNRKGTLAIRGNRNGPHAIDDSEGVCYAQLPGSVGEIE